MDKLILAISNNPNDWKIGEFFVFFGGISLVIGYIWNTAEKQFKTLRSIELKIADTNSRIDALENRLKLFAYTASNKQNENALRIGDIERFLSANHNFHIREVNSNSGAPFLETIREDFL